MPPAVFRAQVGSNGSGERTCSVRSQALCRAWRQAQSQQWSIARQVRGSATQSVSRQGSNTPSPFAQHRPPAKLAPEPDAAKPGRGKITAGRWVIDDRQVLATRKSADIERQTAPRRQAPFRRRHHEPTRAHSSVARPAQAGFAGEVRKALRPSASQSRAEVGIPRRRRSPPGRPPSLRAKARRRGSHLSAAQMTAGIISISPPTPCHHRRPKELPRSP